MIRKVEKHIPDRKNAVTGNLPSLSVILITGNSEERNRLTAEDLLSQTAEGSLFLLIYLRPDFREEEARSWLLDLREKYPNVTVYPDEEIPRPVLLNHARFYVQDGGYVTVMNSGDRIAPDYFETILSGLKKEHVSSGEDPSFRLAVSTKIQRDGKADPVSPKGNSAPQEVFYDTRADIIPYCLNGTLADASAFKNHTFREDLRYGYEIDFLLRQALRHKVLKGTGRTSYQLYGITEFDTRNFPGYYEREWYYEEIDTFWLPLLEEVEEKEGEVPRFIQKAAFLALQLRTVANLNNNNKHAVPEESAEEYIRSWERILRYISDEMILNAYKQGPQLIDTLQERFFLQVKHSDPNLRFEITHMNKTPYYGRGEVLEDSLLKKSVEIIHMERVEDGIHVEGVLSGIFDPEEGSFSITCDKQEIPIHYTERYTLTKLFGVSIYKQHPFEFFYRLEDTLHQRISFLYTDSFGSFTLPLRFSAHWSKLTEKMKNAYWSFASEGVQYMMTYNKKTLLISRIGNHTRKKRERKLRREMLFSKNPTAIKIMLLRMAYFFLERFLHRRPIWMFYDKIYKGGDSAEYLYRFSAKKKDGIKKYYLIDKNAPEYKRLKADGLKPLVRGSYLHRLIFLYADLMIVSNSTVCEFNDLPAAKSAYLRDLLNFHVVCVQHGMSVQKIAVAQNRLRDNTRLYFCASKYELRNLYKPVYDYEGRHALKLTGVPRYDGLINNDRRQILITPTWRMQAALAPNGNEGVEREYNPGFKRTMYFKEYNALINDRRLIDAAKQYGYRIVYVLHPIVSPQLKDFTKNDYVDIVPSTGDMSYEKVLCESSLMVTDYSGVQFDFAYMRKPIVYFHSDTMPTHYEEGTFHYDTMGFGEIVRNREALVDLLVDYMKNDCTMKDEYRERADDFFEFSDRNNCSRIYDVLLPYTGDLMAMRKENRFRTLPQAIKHSAVEGNLLSGRLIPKLHLNANGKPAKILKKIDRHLAFEARRTYFRKDPIRNNRIFFVTYDSNFICNPKYIAEAILRRKLDVELYWAIPANGKIDRSTFPAKIHLVRRNSEAMLRALATSRVWIENAMDIPLYGIRKREGQVFINTWHGSLGIKRLSGDDAWMKRANSVGPYTDYCMTNSAFEEEVFRTTFWPKTPFLKYGHARNDLFFNHFVMHEKRAHVLETYHLPEDRKLFLYAPTFRESGMAAYESADMEMIHKALVERFGGEWTILVRWHHKERARKTSAGKSRHVIDASQFGDMQELLPAIDAGMSDYSSWVFDYILSGRPIFLYAPDVADYDQARGFYYPIESTPFPIAHNNKELKNCILNFDEARYAQDVKTFLEGKGCYEDGRAAERIVDFIEELTSGAK